MYYKAEPVKPGIPRKVQEWPFDWDLHILNTCEFYFEDSRLELINGASFCNFLVHSEQNFEELRKELNVSGLEVRLLFKINEDIYYSCVLSYAGNNKVRVTIFTVNYVIDETAKFQDVQYSNIIAPKDSTLFLMYPVAHVQGNSAHFCVRETEKKILEHYDDGGGENNDSPDPVDPNSFDFVEDPIPVLY
tara:strand:+ start:40 stop:609 length:570 start_codon:yes stop_codon:yes gene_type:complete